MRLFERGISLSVLLAALLVGCRPAPVVQQSSDGLVPSIEQLTQAMSAQLDGLKRSTDEADRSERLSRLGQLVQERKARMAGLIETDPRGFVRAAMPESLRMSMPEQFQADLEARVTVKGILQAWVREEPGTKVHYL